MVASLQEVTIAQLRGELTAAELEAVPGAVFGTDENSAEVVEAWLGEKLLQACDRVVAAVNSCSRNQRIMTGLCKVPAACVRTVLVLSRHAVISAIPGLSDTLEGSSRAAEYSTAVQDLSRLASCEFVPEYSLTAEEGSTGNSGVTLVLGSTASDYLF